MVMKLVKKIFRRLTGKRDIYIDDYKWEIKKYLTSSPVILEAGACDGKDTLQMATLWPKATIHSFEPVPELFEKAKERLKGVKNVKLYPYALSDKTGKIQLHLSSGLSEGSSSILSPNKHLEVHPDVKFEQTIYVNSYSIDDWAKQHHVDKIDFMWLDLQGAEFNVLQSSPKIFDTLKVLFTEVSIIETYSNVTLYPEFRKWLEDRKFRVVLEDLPYVDMGNVLLVRE
ncbi:MAG TPA: FkbM family methyltransferase [Ohtaekwangia sp.]|uniref:FkbM family methyltransferase n=1 Tax=Ohtaekwangia sp. TaxID=2066019 RepID=UPI002F95180C